MTPPPALPNGLIVVAKRDCPTCTLIEPLLFELAQGSLPLTVYVQDEPSYAAGLAGRVQDDTLEHSYRLKTEFVPTLIRVEAGLEVARTHGWHRGDWQDISGLPALGAALPALRAGCASKTLDPGVAEELQLRFGDSPLQSRQVTLGDSEDDIEACFSRGLDRRLARGPPHAATGVAHACRHHAPARRSVGFGAA